MSNVQITITCSGCEQQVTAFVQAQKVPAVSRHLEQALAAAHHADCYVEADHGQDQGSTNPGATGPEGGSEADPTGEPPASAVH